MSKTRKVKTIMFLVASALMVYGTAAYAASPNPITAIDIALEPDSTMIQRAETVNALLRMSYPKGFALGETHHPQNPRRDLDMGRFSAFSRPLE